MGLHISDWTSPGPPAGEVNPIPGYRIREKIGTGTLGEVFRAEQIATGQEVSLKVLRSNWGLDRDLRRLVNCQHPAVVPLLDYNAQHKPSYLVTAYFRHTLAQTALAPRTELWFRQLASGLHFLHKEGLSHLNLKLTNVVLDATGNARLVDFGQTFLRGDDAPTGSFWFMPPDQAEGGPVSAAWDVYALGATLYTVLTGRPPRYDERLDMALQEPRSLSYRLDLYRMGLPNCPLLPLQKVDPRLQRVIERCLALSPTQRFVNAEQAMLALDARPTSGVSMSLVVGLALVAIAAVAYTQSSAPDPPPPAQTPIATATAAAVVPPPETPVVTTLPPPATPAAPTLSPTPRPVPKVKTGPVLDWRELGLKFTFPVDYVMDEQEAGRALAHNRGAPGHRIEVRCEKGTYPNYDPGDWTPTRFDVLPKGRLYSLHQADRDGLRLILFQGMRQVSLHVDKQLPDPLDLTPFLKQAAAALTLDGRPLPPF